MIETEAEVEVDQSRATTADVGAPALWSQGITGAGIRIAVLDTGLDATHPDLDDRDFRNWSSLLNPPKVVDARSFLGGACAPLAGATDGHGHGTHVAGIATGTGEGTPAATDNGRYAGIAPGAELAVGKVLTDAGAGLNSDLLAAMEWAATPAGSSSCAIGAHVVNLSLGSESRPVRLNTGSDIDLVSLMLNRLAVRYGTVFVAAAGNSGPYIGSVLETPGAAAQALSVGASAKDYDLNHDDTLSGDTCAGYQHPPSPANDCSAGVGTQPPSLGSFSSRGPAGDLWLRPDLSAPGYNIVSAQAATGVGARPERPEPRDPRRPAVRDRDGDVDGRARDRGQRRAPPAGVPRPARRRFPAGVLGLAGLTRPSYALVRAALMNTAGSGQHEARWILSTDLATRSSTARPSSTRCSSTSAASPRRSARSSATRSSTRCETAPPIPTSGRSARAPGKLNVGRALTALRDGVVVYSAASGSGQDAGTGPKDLQGSWQIGATTRRCDAHAALRRPRRAGRAALAGAVLVRAREPVRRQPCDHGGQERVVDRPPEHRQRVGGTRRGRDVQGEGSGRTPLPATTRAPWSPRSRTARCCGSPSSPRSRCTTRTWPSGSAVPRRPSCPRADVFAKSDTIWPSAAGAAGTGAGSDWLVYAVELGTGLREARFRVHDAAAGDETYDLYVYGADYDLRASTHPFAADGVTDVQANNARGPSTQPRPQTLTLSSPAAGRYYVAVSRAKVGLLPGSGDFGAFVLALDEVR